MLTLSVVSDLHLEARPLELGDVIDPGLSSDVLALLGDIGDPTSAAYGEFIAACASRFRTVLLLAGNNEYRNPTGRSMAQTEELIRARVAPYRNVHFLQNSIHVVGNVCFIGSTLWSHVPNEPIPPPPQPQLTATAAAEAAAPPQQEAPRQAAPAPAPPQPPLQPEAAAAAAAAAAGKPARPPVPQSPFVTRAPAAAGAPRGADSRHSGGGGRESGDGGRSGGGNPPAAGRGGAPTQLPGLTSSSHLPSSGASSGRDGALLPGGHSASLPLYAATSLACAHGGGGDSDSGADACGGGGGGGGGDDCGGRQRRSVDHHHHRHHHHARRRCRLGCAPPRRTVSLSALPPDAPCPPAFAEVPGSSVEEATTSTSGSGSGSGSGSESSGVESSGSGSDSEGGGGARAEGGKAGALLPAGGGGAAAARWAPRPAGPEAAPAAPSPIAAASASQPKPAAAAAPSPAAAVSVPHPEQPQAADAPATQEPQHQPHAHHPHHDPLARRSRGHHHHHRDPHPAPPHPAAAPAPAPAPAPQLTATPRDYLAATSLDYRLIYARPGGEPISPETTNALFAANVAFLQSTVRAALAQGLQPVVLTHHAPARGGTSHPRFAGHPATYAYSSDLEPWLTGSGIVAWYCGHTHYNFDRTLQGGVRLASNQFGSQPQPAAGYSRAHRHHLPSGAGAAGAGAGRATAEERAGAIALRAVAKSGLSGIAGPA